MKKLKDLKGAKVLSRKEQQVLKGGEALSCLYGPCPKGWDCTPLLHVCFLSPPGWYTGD
ncbi:MAG: hypothetical protein AB7S69_07690 [Salinivirgaceae bacterium]